MPIFFIPKKKKTEFLFSRFFFGIRVPGEGVLPVGENQPELLGNGRDTERERSEDGLWNLSEASDTEVLRPRLGPDLARPLRSRCHGVWPHISRRVFGQADELRG